MVKTITIGLVALAFIAGSIMTGGIVFADEAQTKLVKECSKIPKTPDKIKPHCELLEMINAIPAGSQGEQGIQGEPGTNGDAGTNGEDGSSCTIDGTIVSCTDGSSNDVQGPAGTNGANGDKGDPRADGTGIVNGFYTVWSERTIVPPLGGSGWTLHADCNPGDKAISGLYNGWISRGLEINAETIGNAATPENRWSYQIYNPTNEDLGITVGAVCADITP